MSRNFHTPISATLGDDTAERVRRSHERAIKELQDRPASSMVVIPNVALVDGVSTVVPHSLGRTPTFVREGTPRGATSTGRIDEIRDGSVDPAKAIVLKATGWGATITVDVQVL